MTEESKSGLKGLEGLRVLSLESRRAPEMAKLIAAYGGTAMVAPSMREAPLDSHTEALAFAETLAIGGFDVVIFLTGVGTRALTRVVERVYPREKFVEYLGRVDVVARGPKPVAALAEMGVPVAIAAPEPNTWRELIRALDENQATVPLERQRVAVQEYGAANPELLAALAERGAVITRVPVYEWALPEDLAPLRSAVEAIARGEVDIVLFTTSIQVLHLLKVAAQMGREENVRRAFGAIVAGSIGPVTTEVLQQEGLRVDFEPEHPKMGYLVSEAAKRAGELLQRKRSVP